jgi:thiamine-phosphate pyrophosphorylase
MRGLYAIIDPQSCPSDPFAIATQILAGGCAALQLRDKHADDATFSVLGSRLAAACRAHGVPFFVNDRFWLVAQLEASGVHLGQTDASLAEVRRILGRERVIGISTHSRAQALMAEREGADLIGFGPVFDTRTKLAADPTVGLAALAQVCAEVRIPVVAIGGLTLERAWDVRRAGASMGAAISALCAAPSPEAAARALHAELRSQRLGSVRQDD